MPPRKPPTNGRNRRIWHLKRLNTQTREVVRDLLQLLADKGRPAGHGVYYDFKYSKGLVDLHTRYTEAHDITNNTRPGIARYRTNHANKVYAMYGNGMYQSHANPYRTDVQIAQRILNTYSKWVELGADRLAYHGNLFLHDYHYHYQHPNGSNPPNRNIPSNSFVPSQIQNANKLRVNILLSTPKGRADLRSAPVYGLYGTTPIPVDNNRTHWNLEVSIATECAGYVGYEKKNESVHLTFPLWEDSWLRAQLQGSKQKPAFDINSIRAPSNIPRYQERYLMRLWKELLYGLLQSNIHTLLH